MYFKKKIKMAVETKQTKMTFTFLFSPAKIVYARTHWFFVWLITEELQIRTKRYFFQRQIHLLHYYKSIIFFILKIFSIVDSKQAKTCKIGHVENKTGAGSSFIFLTNIFKLKTSSVLQRTTHYNGNQCKWLILEKNKRKFQRLTCRNWH